MAEKKECGTCKHKEKTAKQKPCFGCWKNDILTFTNWESDLPPDELDKEAQSLIEMFYAEISGMELSFISKHIQMPNGDSHFKTAKQCAIIHCDLMLKELPMYTGNLNPRWKHYKDLKQKIEAL